MGVMQRCYWVGDSIFPIVSNALNFLSRLCMGMDEASALVRALCASAACILCRGFVACVNVSLC